MRANRKLRFSGLGFFGKGVVAPPPGPPPAAIFRAGQWVCDTAKPVATDPNKYWHCCPSGWVQATHGDTQPCKGPDRDLLDCGPLPEGASTADAVCCPRIRQWVPKTSTGDPCADAENQTGQAIPGRPETILAPDIEFQPEPLISPKFLMIGGLAAGLVVIATIIALRK